MTYQHLCTFRGQGQQNTCPDANIRLKNSVLYVTQQCVHGAVHDREHTETSRLLKLLSTYPSQYSYIDKLATILHTEMTEGWDGCFKQIYTPGNGQVRPETYRSLHIKTLL